jgi:hypothetical protein
MASNQIYIKANDALRSSYYAKKMYQAITNDIFRIILSPFAFIPIILAGLYLRYLIVRIKLSRKQSIDQVDHNQLMSTYDAISRDIKYIRIIKDLDRRKAPWILRDFVRNIQVLAYMISDQYEVVQNYIDKLDKVNDGKFFQAVSTKQLWQDRCKAYSYRM